MNVPKPVMTALAKARAALKARHDLETRIEALAAEREDAATRKQEAHAAALRAELGGRDGAPFLAAAREAETALARLSGLASGADQARADLTAAVENAAEALRVALWAWAHPAREQAIERFREEARRLAATAAELDAWSALIGLPEYNVRIIDPVERVSIEPAARRDDGFAQFASDVRSVARETREFVHSDRHLERAA